MRRFAFTFVALLAGVLMWSSTSVAQEVPPTDADGNEITEQPAAALVAPTLAPQQLTFVPEGASLSDTPTILIDDSKGALFGVNPVSYFADFTQLLNEQGYSVEITLDGVLGEDMSQYDVFFATTVLTATSYSELELAALDQFVAQGGSLFIAGEADGCGGCPAANSNLSVLSERFGDIRVGVNTLSPTDYFFGTASSHPVMAGVHDLYYRFGGALEVNGSATAVARTISGARATVAVNDNIVVVGDGSFLSNNSGSEFWDRVDNNLFISNAFAYLVEGGSGPRQLCASNLVTISGAGNIMGTPGDDVILGSAGADMIDGGGGNDIICGRGGNDEINGGPGNDIVYAGSGIDRVNGQSGNDRVYGGPGNDILWGNAGDDIMGGGPDDDRLVGGPGDDSMGGGLGRDFCRGSAGADRYFKCEATVV